MSTLISRTEVTNVTAIQRPGVGYIYRAVITIGLLYQALRDSVIRYAPRYQRGFRRSQEDIPEADYDLLLPINDERLQLDLRRAQAMAVKFLIALNGDPRGKRLFTSFVVWNARRDEGRPEPKLHEDGTLELRTVLTVPDTGHRHLAYFLLGSWKHQETSIPDEVTIDEGDVVSRAEIEKCLENFDPDDPTTSSLFVDIYSLDAEQEGWLYDEFNADAKPPAGAVAIDLNQQKTPSRRFVYRLMERSPIFDRTQVETRANTIGSRSRKLTTNATMESAVRPYSKRLVKLEQDGTGAYDDLINFFAAFFSEWANHFPAFGPDASGDQRQAFRGESFALSNIMFFPLFRLVFELWEKYHGKVEWTTQDEWRDAIARLAAKVTATDPEDPAKKIKVDFMSRENPDWQGRILVRKFNSNGEFTGWSLSSTRQTRDAAFHQLVKQARVSLPQRASAKGRRA
jgi:DNA-sulfur modification-associated